MTRNPAIHPLVYRMNGFDPTYVEVCPDGQGGVQLVDPNRVPIGRLNGITAAPGTLLGPDGAGQWYVALRSDDQGVQVGYATTHDIDNAKARHGAGGSPRSLPEFKIWSPR